MLLLLALCIMLPIGFLFYYQYQYCLFPPNESNIEVVISACDVPILYSVSPDGRYLSYAFSKGNTYKLWLLDTTTGERNPDTLAGNQGKAYIWWLTGTVRVMGEPTNGPLGRFEIIDISDGSKVPAQWVEGIPGTTTRLADGSETYSPDVVKWFQNAQQVYYVSLNRWAVALGPDFKTHPQDNYVLAMSGDLTNSVLKFLKDSQIPYHEIGYPNDGSDVVSYDGSFMIPSFGIEGFYTANGTRIGSVYNSSRKYEDCCRVYGWAYDDSGVYVQGNTQGSGTMFPSPPRAQPILKIYLPTEYLTPLAYQRLEEYQKRAWVGLIIKVSVLILLFVAGLWLFWWRKKKRLSAMF